MSRTHFALAALLLASEALAAQAPKPFESGWDNPANPDRDCTIRRNGGTLTIEMPGTIHEYNVHCKRLNAPRLLRDIEGDFEMEVRVRIDCRPSARSSVEDLPSYVSAGFLVIQPEKFGISFDRSEYRVGGQGIEAEGCAAILLQGSEGEGGNGLWTKKHPKWPFKAKPDYVYLRLSRQGGLLGMFISPDRRMWNLIGGTLNSERPSKLTVGLAAFTTSTDPSKVIFDQLTLRHGNKRVPWEFASGWGNPIDPDKDCKIQRDKDALTIDMPGTDHDYDPLRKRFNAPRLLSDLEGEFDLQVRVRIDYRPSAKSTVKGQPSFVSAGFLLIYPEREYSICARVEFAVSQQGNRRDAYAVPPRLPYRRRGGPVSKGKEAANYALLKRWVDFRQPDLDYNNIWEGGWQDWPLPEKTDYAYLRLDHRVAEEWSSFFISPDGKKWTRLDYLPSVPAKGKVGLAAYSTSTEPSKVRFDQVKLWRPKKNSK